LIADDQKFNIEALIIILEYLVKVDTSICDQVLNGQSAYDSVVENVTKNEFLYCDYKLVLMDHDMPFMNGNQACKKIISFLHEHKIPKPVLISVSGSSGTKFEKECKESGIDYILSKPVNGQELKEIIEYINFPR